MAGYSAFRRAARSGVERAGGKPILIEDQPARPESPRTACLDLVASSDAALFIIGPRGGYRGPSNKLVVREEFDEAQAKNIPTIVLLQEVDRDADGQQLADDLSEWVKGRLRRTFRTPEELEAEVASALIRIMETMTRPSRDPQSLQDLLTGTSQSPGQYETLLRLVLAPTVEEEVIDPLLLDTAELKQVVQGAAHEAEFLSYEFGKKLSASSDRLRVIQGDDRGKGYAEIVVGASGVVSLASSVTGRSEREASFSHRAFSESFEIVRSDFEGAISAAFDFASRLLQHVDEHERYASWIYNAALINPGMKSIVDRPAHSNQGYSVGSRQPEVVTAYEQPRPINRSQLSRPEQEVRRVATLLQKRLEESRS